ncbi:MAG TPA: manganese transporter, partial [Thermoanaerobaculia bacterium]|nr:manganese transporter [Thermoanaerobaculia bacterium]
LLCNDRDVLGPWVNKLWLNVIATVILGALLMLSGILMVTTVFPNVNVPLLLTVLAGLLVVALGGLGALTLRGRQAGPPVSAERRETWTMKPIALLGHPPRSRIRTVTMATMYAYLFLSVILLAVKAAKLAGGL